MGNHASLIRSQNSGKAILDRGRNHITFDNGDGSKRAVFTIDPLHMRNSSTEIDVGFIADTGAWQWKLAQADYQVHTRDIYNSGALVEWRHASDQWIIVDPQSINWVNQDYSRQQIAIKQAVSATVNDAMIRWSAAYGVGRHFEFEANPRRLRKRFIIDAAANLPAPTVTGTIHFEAEFTLSTSTGVDFWLDGVKWAKTNGVRVKTIKRIEFRNTENTETLWYAEAPIATDSGVGDAQKSTTCEFEVRRQGGPANLFINIRVPKTWIDTAVFPLVIETPGFTDGYGGDVTTAKDTIVNNASGATQVRNYGTTANLTGATYTKLLLQFDLSSIDASATCDRATFYMYKAVDDGNAATWICTAYAIASGNANWPEGTHDGATGDAGDCCWDHLDQTAGSETNWAGSAGLSTSGTDYEASSLGSFNGRRDDDVGLEYSTTLTAARVEDWFGASNTNYGILVIPSSSVPSLCSSDHATTGYCPKLVVTYTAGGGGVPKHSMYYARQRRSK